MGFLKRKKDLEEIPVSNLKNEEKEDKIRELLREKDASLYQLEEILEDIAEESGNKRLRGPRRRKGDKNI